MNLTTSKSLTGRRGLFAFAVFALALVSACSSTTFVYNRLDFIVPWYVGRYVDFDRGQSTEFKGLLNATLEWHRAQELPRYAGLLAEMEQEIDRPEINLARVEAYSRRIESDWYRLRDRVLADMLQVGETLSDEQVDEFIATLEKKQRKYERKYLERDDDEFHEDAYDELREAFEDFMGRLSGEQREQVRLTADSLKRSDAIWLEKRAEWLLVTAEDLKRAPGWQERIRERVVNWEEQLDPATLAIYDYNTTAVQLLVVELFNTRSERQEKRLRRKVSGYLEDIELLTAQSEDLPLGQGQGQGSG